MAIYTKKGDRGVTRVFDKKTGKLIEVSKGSCKIVTIGTIDELNSLLGVIGELESVQKDLFTINSIIAGAKLRFLPSKVKSLERQIDKWEGSLPPLKNFIIYGGTPKASLLFYARSVARRAERSLVALSKKREVGEVILMYVNRLSDYLFMLARHENHTSGKKEKVWKR